MSHFSRTDDNIRPAQVTAHVRHAETQYDKLLASGLERWEARAEVERKVAQVLAAWESAERS